MSKVTRLANEAKDFKKAAKATKKAAKAAGNSVSQVRNSRFSRNQFTATSPSGTKQNYTVYQQKIDWGLVRDGKTNAERARAGHAPYIMKKGQAQQLQLHHSRQDSRGSLFELSESTHLRTPQGKGKIALKPYGNRKHPTHPVDRGKFAVDKREYWISRAKDAGY